MPDWLDRVKDAALNVATLGEHEHPGGLRDYGSQTLHSLDPRTPEGLASLAAMFVPGPGGRGGKFTGRLTETQKNFLRQLKGFRGGETYRIDPRVAERYPMLEEIAAGRRTEYRPRETGGSLLYPLNESLIKRTRGLKEMSDLLGATTKPPMNHLLDDLMRYYQGIPGDKYAASRLGVGPEHGYRSDFSTIQRPAGEPGWNTPIIDPNAKALVELIARSNIQRRN